MQLRHYLEQIIRGTIEGRGLEVITMFTSAYHFKLYKGVEDLKGNDTVYIKERWQREANIVI